MASQKLLSTIFRLKSERRQRFGAGQVVDILLGKKTAKVTQFGHDSLSVFGVGTELGDGEWRGVVRQLLAQGLLMVEGDYSTLALTPASAAVLRGEHQVMLRREPEKTARTAKPRHQTTQDELPEHAVPVFERLRAWRGATAKEQGVPAYVVFHDATLRQIATQSPTTLAALGEISGIGENKLAKYGQQILDTLAD